MGARVAISDPLPAFCRGVAAILREAGLEAETPSDLLAWADDDEVKVLFLSVITPRDWSLLERLTERDPEAVVVAMLEDPGVPSYVRALTAGAVIALPRDASPSAIREAYEAIITGRSLIPTPVLHALVRRPAELEAGRPSPREREWMRDLAGGMTVSQLAAKAGYSERMMFRLLRDLYSRFGASTKVEALMLARENGWL
jgi:DNA-binding NarL/FixJ family response regulator